MIVLVVVIIVIGCVFGGYGMFEDVILLIVWVELIFVGL